MIELKHAGYVIGKKWLVRAIDLSLRAGELVVLMGPNGAGKSSLLKLIAGTLQPTEGEILFERQAIGDIPKEVLARKRAVLSQHYHLAFPVLVKDLVMMGRYPYFTDRPSAEDESVVDRLMGTMDVLHLKDRYYDSLSGGEAQKVQMCRVLAQLDTQQPQINRMLLLDEPVSHLDMHYQQQLMSVAKSVVSKDIAVLAVLHDINLALKFADRILFMQEGRILHEHKASDVLDTELLKKIFQLDTGIQSFSDGNRQWILS